MIKLTSSDGYEVQPGDFIKMIHIIDPSRHFTREGLFLGCLAADVIILDERGAVRYISPTVSSVKVLSKLSEAVG